MQSTAGTTTHTYIPSLIALASSHSALGWDETAPVYPSHRYGGKAPDLELGPRYGMMYMDAYDGLALVALKLYQSYTTLYSTTSLLVSHFGY